MLLLGMEDRRVATLDVLEKLDRLIEQMRQHRRGTTVYLLTMARLDLLDSLEPKDMGSRSTGRAEREH